MPRSCRELDPPDIVIAGRVAWVLKTTTPSYDPTTGAVAPPLSVAPPDTRFTFAPS